MKIRALLITLIVLLPGCLEEGEDTTEGDDVTYDGVYSNITMNIFHGENLENATANYTIKIMLNHTAAPIHTDNMRKHVIAGNYNMTHFHRIIDNFMIQGGDFENHDGTGGYAADWYGYCNGQSASNQSACNQSSWTMPDEADNGLVHDSCVISMAKTSNPNTGGSQFFIVPEDSEPSHLDGVHTVFGEITEGCEHVTTISEVATDGSDRPITPVTIYNATAEGLPGLAFAN
jgi:cyclophilin family peptidyl-prolyl cis-trans isomerase